MMTEPIYFAGGMYKVGPNEYAFKLVTPGGKPHDLPYLTKNPNGLKTTSHHASLYVLAPDMKTAKMVQPRAFESPIRVTLTEAQQAKVQESLDSGVFCN